MSTFPLTPQGATFTGPAMFDPVNVPTLTGGCTLEIDVHSFDGVNLRLLVEDHVADATYQPVAVAMLQGPITTQVALSWTPEHLSGIRTGRAGNQLRLTVLAADGSGRISARAKGNG